MKVKTFFRDAGLFSVIWGYRPFKYKPILPPKLIGSFGGMPQLLPNPNINRFHTLNPKCFFLLGSYTA